MSGRQYRGYSMSAVGGSVGVRGEALPPGTKSTDNFVYYDASITNTSTTTAKEAKFRSSGSELVLSNPSDYAVSVVRFTIPTDNIPLVDNLSFIGTGDYKIGTNTILNVRPSSSANIGSSILPGWLINYPTVLPNGTTVTSVVTNADQSLTITMSQNALATSTTDLVSMGGYVVTMSTTDGKTYSLPVIVDNRLDTYASIVQNINLSFHDCFSELKALDSGFLCIDAPFLILDTSTDKLSIYSQKGYWRGYLRSTTVPNVGTLYLNTALNKLLKGLSVPSASAGGIAFQDYYVSLGDASSNHGVNPNGLGAYPTITSTGINLNVSIANTSTLVIITVADPSYSFWVGQSITGTGIPALTTIATIIDRNSFTITNAATATGSSVPALFFPAPYTAYVNTQTSSSLPLWTPIQRIVFTTSMSVSTQVTQNLSIEDLSSNTDINNNQYRPVLIDFEPVFGTDDYTPYQYFPQGPWRFNDFIGSTDLRTVDIQVYWIDNRGGYNLVLIPPNDKCTILLAFVRKSFVTY